MINKDSISILGTGSWGNTLAYLLGQDRKIILWGHDPKKLRRLMRTRRFKKPIKLKYPDNIVLTNDLRDILESQIIINTISLKGMDNVFSEIAKFKPSSEHIFVNGSKGIDSINLQTPTEIMDKYLPENPKAVISGPNLAKELIKAKPMVTEIASKNLEIAKLIQEKISSPSLRVYTNDDVKGVELCAALKNVIAIAAGLCDALKLGESAKASLIARGLHEMKIFIASYGCKSETILGPAGVGDLIATCASNLSRNHRVGFLLAEGKKLKDIVNHLGEVAEGINTTHAVYKIAKEKNIEMPIVFQIKKLLDGEITAIDAVLSLMNRPIK